MRKKISFKKCEKFSWLHNTVFADEQGEHLILNVHQANKKNVNCEINLSDLFLQQLSSQDICCQSLRDTLYDSIVKVYVPLKFMVIKLIFSWERVCEGRWLNSYIVIVPLNATLAAGDVSWVHVSQPEETFKSLRRQWGQWLVGHKWDDILLTQLPQRLLKAYIKIYIKKSDVKYHTSLVWSIRDMGICGF